MIFPANIQIGYKFTNICHSDPFVCHLTIFCHFDRTKLCTQSLEVEKSMYGNYS